MAPVGGEDLDSVPTGPAAVAVFVFLVTFVGVILFFYRRWLVAVMDVTYLNSFSHAGKGLSILLAVLLLKEALPAASLLGFAARGPDSP